MNALKSLIRGTPFEAPLRRLLGRDGGGFRSSSDYWDQRYRDRGNSGAGSYGRLALFKAEILNAFVADHTITSVIEFGCGDGHQLSLADYPRYTGVDVSSTVIDQCRAKFAEDRSKSFVTTQAYAGARADLALSLDVIYHLVEDEVFETYMAGLFSASERYVIIYSSNTAEAQQLTAHVRHRRFTDWVEAHQSDFELQEMIPNRYPFDEADPDNSSLADFYIYTRR